MRSYEPSQRNLCSGRNGGSPQTPRDPIARAFLCPRPRMSVLPWGASPRSRGSVNSAVPSYEPSLTRGHPLGPKPLLGLVARGHLCDPRKDCSCESTNQADEVYVFRRTDILRNRSLLPGGEGGAVPP
jgi:hypothetical protein